MATVQNFDRSVIESYLTNRGLRFTRDDDGDFVVQFPYQEELGCEVILVFCAEGPQEDVYSVRLISNKRIPKDEWERIMSLCNDWNKEKRFPKAFLDIRITAEETLAIVVLEQHLHLKPGVHQDLFDDWTDIMVSGGFQFWIWVHQQHGL
jgi:hypothetical protein